MVVALLWSLYISERYAAAQDHGVIITPDKITEGWQVGLGFKDAWLDAPKVRARVYTAEEARAEAERLEQERQRAMAQAKQARRIKLVGQEEGDLHAIVYSMGVYELEEGKEVNARGVWKAMGKERFMWYAKENWGVGDKRSAWKRARKDLCCMWQARPSRPTRSPRLGRHGIHRSKHGCAPMLRSVEFHPAATANG